MGPKKGKDKWEIMKQKLANPRTQKMIYGGIMALVLAAMVLIVLYFLKLRSITEKYRAATKIHEFMQRYNESYKGKQPIRAFKAVEEILGELQKLHARNRDLQKSINGIIDKILEGWLPFGGHLYKFINKALIFEEARRTCESNNTMLAEVHSDEEQEFIVDAVFYYQVACWLGIIKKKNQWQWLSGGTPTKLSPFLCSLSMLTLRMAFTSLRFQAMPSAVRMGHVQGLPASQQLCICAMEETEDLPHYMIRCPLFFGPGDKFIANLPTLLGMVSDVDKVTFLLADIDPVITRRVAEFALAARSIRFKSVA